MFGFAICWHMLILRAVCSAICSVNLNNNFLSYHSSGARKVQVKVVFLILKYYLGFATCTDSYVDVFFCPSCRDNS